MQDSYKTIAKKCEGLFKDKGSKFFSFAIPVQQEDEINSIITSYRREFHDARHHCYAYRLGYNGATFRANDDNEPTYTAGKPILGQIDTFGLTNILVIVVRYFGGTLLGKSGLKNAYKNACYDALSKAKVIEKTVNKYFQVHCRYEDISKVTKILKDCSIEPFEQIFEIDCKFKIGIRISKTDQILNKMKIIKSVKIDYLYTA